jgi:hypothetical protein
VNLFCIYLFIYYKIVMSTLNSGTRDATVISAIVAYAAGLTPINFYVFEQKLCREACRLTENPNVIANFFADPAAYVIPVFPDPIPAGGIPGDATGELMRLNLYQVKQASEFDHAQRTIKTAIVAAIAIDYQWTYPLIHCGQPTLDTVSVPQILLTLRNLIGNPSAVDFDTLHVELAKSKPSGISVQAHLARLTEIFTCLAQHNQPIAEMQKISIARKSIEGYKIYDTVVEYYLNSHTAVSANPIRTYDRFAAYVVSRAHEIEMLAANENGAHAMRQAARTKQTTTVDSLVKELTELKLQVASMKPKAANHGAASKPQYPAKKSTTEEPLYCWTHGVVGHSSADCKHPREGHMKAAHNRNRMGGAIPNPTA